MGDTQYTILLYARESHLSLCPVSIANNAPKVLKLRKMCHYCHCHYNFSMYLSVMYTITTYMFCMYLFVIYIPSPPTHGYKRSNVLTDIRGRLQCQ